jgi:hypothetical protein
MPAAFFKNTLLLSLICIVLIAACKHDKTKSVIIKKAVITNKKPPQFADTTTIMLVKQYPHLFSDQTKKDTFKLILKGGSILTGKVTFDIIAYNGKLIFTEKFDAIDLLGDLDDVTNNRQKVDTIKSRFAAFFNESAFTKPALDNKAPLDSDYVDIKIQKDIRADTTATGFFYAYGYEGVYEIAYSRRKKKVVTCMESD